VIEVRLSTVDGAHDNWPRQHKLPWDVLAARCADHRPGDKDGVALICGLFAPGETRSSKTVLERELIALDVEQNKETGEVPPDPESVTHYLMAKRLAAVIWTTHSHTIELPRYRILLPLSAPLNVAQAGRALDKMYSAVTAANLRLNGVVDRGKFGAASLMYLARHKPGAAFWSHIVEGEPVNAPELHAVSYMANAKDQMKAAQRAALKATTEFPPEVRAKIDRFNSINEITDLLSEYGYRRAGDRWKSRYQHPTSQPATAIFPDHAMWCSFSESDKDAGLGTPSDECIFGDAFALFLHYAHGGNFRAALADIELPEDWKDHVDTKPGEG
jgi:hypothetical protein